MVWSFEKSDALPEKQFFQWESLLERRTGIQLAQAQHVLLQTQVALRMRELRIDSYDEYFSYVQDDLTGIAEWQILVDRLMVKETTFFRHRPSLNFVKQLLKKRLADDVNNKSFEMWSVGCSTGEEPYALAAIANDCFNEAGLTPYYGVTGVDISLPALAIAREGVYSQRSVKHLTAEEMQKYFIPVGSGSNGKQHYRIVDPIKKRVCFSQLNVLGLKDKPLQLMDVIFCQNVLIYFRRWRRREIIAQLARHLKKGGVLLIGLGEITDLKVPGLERIAHEGVQAYMKYS